MKKSASFLTLLKYFLGNFMAFPFFTLKTKKYWEKNQFLGWRGLGRGGVVKVSKNAKMHYVVDTILCLQLGIKGVLKIKVFILVHILQLNNLIRCFLS